MSTIWKFPIEITDEQEVSMPWGARIIHAGLDPAGVPSVWAIVEPGNTDKSREGISIRGTGHPLPDSATYLNSFNHGPFVWHVFHYPTP